MKKFSLFRTLPLKGLIILFALTGSPRETRENNMWKTQRTSNVEVVCPTGNRRSAVSTGSMLITTLIFYPWVIKHLILSNYFFVPFLNTKWKSDLVLKEFLCDHLSWEVLSSICCLAGLAMDGVDFAFMCGLPYASVFCTWWNRYSAVRYIMFWL